MPFSSNILLENKFINKREKSNIQKETDISEKKKNEINEKEIECYLCRKKSLELLEIKEENEILKEKIKKLEQEKEELKNEKNSNLASEVLII